MLYCLTAGERQQRSASLADQGSTGLGPRTPPRLEYLSQSCSESRERATSHAGGQRPVSWMDTTWPHRLLYTPTSRHEAVSKPRDPDPRGFHRVLPFLWMGSCSCP